VEDGAEGIVLAAERYDDPEPVNLGTGEDIRMKELVQKFRDLVGYQGQVVWGRSQPEGQPRRRLDVEPARNKLGFRARAGFEEGSRGSIEWYQRRMVQPECPK